MFSGACKEPFPAPQLHRIGVRTSRIDWDAGPASERGNYLGRSATFSGPRRSRNRGFSMVELGVSMTVVLIMTAVAIPSLVRSIRTYQLNDTAGRLSDILKFTRFEAVRRNTQISFRFQLFAEGWNVWADSLANTQPDPTERQFLITGWV